MILYIVKDGIENIANVVDANGKRILETNYYILTYDFKTNEGYIDLKESGFWRLYTQIGQKFGQTRYHKELTFLKCIEKLKTLKGNDQIIVCNSSDVENLKKKTTGNTVQN